MTEPGGGARHGPGGDQHLETLALSTTLICAGQTGWSAIVTFATTVLPSLTLGIALLE